MPRFSRVFNCEQLPQKTSVPCRFVDADERLPDEADTYLVLYRNFSVGKPLYEKGKIRFDGKKWVQPVGHVAYWLEIPIWFATHSVPEND